jgi:membrane protein YqaA with SNARE-associated domain
MTQMEAYTLLMFDSLNVALLVPLQNIFIFEVMKIFGTFNPLMMCASAAAGASIAGLLNWIFGRVIKGALKVEASGDRAVLLVNFLKKKEVLLLCLSVIPYAGALLTAIHGVIGGDVRKVLPVVFIAHFAFYFVYYNYL